MKLSHNDLFISERKEQKQQKKRQKKQNLIDEYLVLIPQGITFMEIDFF